MTALLSYIAAAAAVAVLDYATSVTMTFWVLYLLPIGLATWNLGRSRGLAIALVCAGLQSATWIADPLVADVWAGATVLVSRLVVFGVVAALTGALRAKEVPRVVHPAQHTN